MWVRETKLKNREIILKKSRVTITKENVDAYIILKLFTNIDIQKYFDDISIQREIIKFIKDRIIKVKDVIAIAKSFPSKTIRNIMESGVIYQFA